MTRVRSLEGREAGLVARIIQFILRMNVGKNVNPIKVQAHSTRAMVANFLANAILSTGVGRRSVGAFRPVSSASVSKASFMVTCSPEAM